MGSGVGWGREASGDQKTLGWGGPGLCQGSRKPLKCLSSAVTWVRSMCHAALWLMCGAWERAAGSPGGAGRLARG